MSKGKSYEMTESPPGGHENGIDNNGYMISSSHVDLSPTPDGKTHFQEFNPEEEVEPDGCCSKVVYKIQTALKKFYEHYNDEVWLAIKILCVIAYFVYFGFAMRYSFGDEGSIRLLVVTVLVVLFILTRILSSICGDKCCSPIDNFRRSYNSWSPSKKKKFAKHMHWLYILFLVGYALFAIIWVIVDVGLKTPNNLTSALGIAIFIIIFYIFSVNPAKVKWRPVLLGLYIQFAFALLILRWDIGYQAFSWLGDRVQEFLAHSDAGAIFVFGDLYTNHFFAFKVLPVIVFFSTMMSVLYYLGVMQFIIRHIARALAFALGTSPAESLNAAGNIFIGQSEAPLMIRPFIAKLTKSELHAVMTGGFATIAGSVMAAYISYGVPANHLIAASVMSAPAALAMAKLFYPETEESEATPESVYQMENMEHSNVIAAASEGASTSISLVANIAANLIAFIAILAFINATLKWCGHRVGWYTPELSFELICSYVFWPMAYVMGVDPIDCRKVAELIGVKTFLNEFVAYLRLSDYITNKELLAEYESNMTKQGLDPYDWYKVNDDIYLPNANMTLAKGILTDRSQVISTYALCGFSNVGSIGIMIGALGALAPSRKTDITQTVVRAMIAGNVACFMTACIAGLLYRAPVDGLVGNHTM